MAGRSGRRSRTLGLDLDGLFGNVACATSGVLSILFVMLSGLKPREHRSLKFSATGTV